MESKLLHTLSSQGRTQAGALSKALGVSRATLMRTVRAVGDAVVTRGQARRTAYAARRAVQGHAASPLPIYRVDEQGDVHEFGNLHLVTPAPACALELTPGADWPLDGTDPDGWWDALPYFVSGLLPQGFMGVQFARRHARALGLPDSPTRWTTDDALWAAAQVGDEAPGNLIVGEAACRRWLTRLAALRLGDATAGVSDDTVERAYASLAAQALDGAAGDAWLGGAQPKFTALRVDAAGRQPRQVLVKFAQTAGSAADQRRADLLVCEHLALGVVEEDLGLAAAPSALVQTASHTFLEVARSDRVGLAGRAPCVAWSALPAEAAGWLGAATDVHGRSGRRRITASAVPAEAAAGAEARSQAVTAALGAPTAPPAQAGPGEAAAGAAETTAQAIQALRAFRRLIGHDAEDDLLLRPLAGRLVLAPVSSLRPAAYAPQGGAVLPDAPLRAALPLPAEREAWVLAARAARRFWQLAARDRRVSEAFRPVCIANALQLRALVA